MNLLDEFNGKNHFYGDVTQSANNLHILRVDYYQIH